MNASSKKYNTKEILSFISTVISWTVFALLSICIALLLYYFVSTQIYARKGEKYTPKFSLYTIVSPSMTPNIKVYDVIVNIEVEEPEEIKIGDVITFVSTSTESMGATVTHRVVSIMQDEQGNYSYQTKGDNNLIEDSSSVPFANVIGRVTLKIPQLGRIQLFVASSYGWLFLILIPALYILLRDLLKALKEKHGNSKFFNGKWYKIMTRPLLIGHKPKLLPEPKVINDTAESPEEESSKNDEPLLRWDDDDLI